jgi:hypothetical protein
LPPLRYLQAATTGWQVAEPQEVEPSNDLGRLVLGGGQIFLSVRTLRQLGVSQFIPDAVSDRPGPGLFPELRGRVVEWLPKWLLRRLALWQERRWKCAPATARRLGRVSGSPSPGRLTASAHARVYSSSASPFRPPGSCLTDAVCKWTGATTFQPGVALIRSH